MTRIFAVVLLVIVTFFSLPAFASEEDKSIHKNTKTDISVAKTDKESPGSKTNDLDGSLKTKKTEIAADHDHYGKFLLFNALLSGGKTRR